MPTGMNIVAAQRQYRWPQANIVFAAGKNIVPQISLLKKYKAGIGKPPPNARQSSSELISSTPFMPTGMNIVAAQRQYRWPKVNIVFAAGKNIVPNSPHPQTTKRALGNKTPNARQSSSELIRRAHVHAVCIRVLHNLCRVARVHAPLVAQRIAAADGEVDTRATRVRAVVALPEG